MENLGTVSLQEIQSALPSAQIKYLCVKHKGFCDVNVTVDTVQGTKDLKWI